MNKQSTSERKIEISKILLPIAAVVMCIVFSIGNSNFLTLSNWTNIGRQQAALLIAAVGQTFVILTGGIDLSQGSLIGFISVVTADVAIKHGFVYAIVTAILIGITVGIIQGTLVAKVRIPAFIVTLGFLNILRGLAYIYSNGMPISGLPAAFSDLGADKILGFPVPLVIAFIILIMAFFSLRYLNIGREIYSVGGNEEASRLAGINITKVRVFAYIMSGVLTAVAGFVTTARVAVGQPTLGEGVQLMSVAAVVIGGTSMRGGEGNVIKTLLGVIMLALISNGLNLLRVSSYTQTVVNGVIIVIAVAIDVLGKRKRD